MRIVMLSPVAPAHGRGGVQDHVWMLCRGLASRGEDVTLVTTAHPNGTAHERVDGIDVHHVTGTPPGRPIGAWTRDSEAMVGALHARAPLDAIHSQSFCALHLAGRFPGVGLTVSLHGTHVDELRTRARLVRESFPAHPVEVARSLVVGARMWQRLRREGPMLRHADAVIATSREQRAVLTRHYHVAPERLHDVWNGIDAGQFAPGPADPALRARLGGGPLVLAVARLYPEKGIHHLVRAWPAVLRAVPAATLVIVGDGPHRAALETLAARVPGDRVRFTGAVELDALPALYRASDVFVNPTVRINGYDLTILQAMATGKAVVVSNIGSVPTAVADGVDGVLVPPGDAAALAAQLVALLRDPARAAALGAAARRTVCERFSLERMVEGTRAVYAAARRMAEARP